MIQEPLNHDSAIATDRSPRAITRDVNNVLDVILNYAELLSGPK